MANVRIIEQPEITTLSGNEYLVTDSATAGTKKITPQNLVAAAGGGSGTGVSEELKAALLQLASKVAYIDDDGQDYYDDLYDALYDTTWQVTNTLTHCSSSNTDASVTKNGSYSATITPASGYTLTGATVSITMGGTDITSTAYSNGTISIASVTGALVISISAAAKTVSSISAVYTQSGTVYDTDSLDSLKTDLVVTAVYTDSSTEVVPSTDYTLSGTLTVGTSTITVSYEGKTTSFNVTVSSIPVYEKLVSEAGTFLASGVYANNPGMTPASTIHEDVYQITDVRAGDVIVLVVGWNKAAFTGKEKNWFSTTSDSKPDYTEGTFTAHGTSYGTLDVTLNVDYAALNVGINNANSSYAQYCTWTRSGGF